MHARTHTYIYIIIAKDLRVLKIQPMIFLRTQLFTGIQEKMLFINNDERPK